jgi:hypothetical protein
MLRFYLAKRFRDSSSTSCEGSQSLLEFASHVLMGVRTMKEGGTMRKKDRREAAQLRSEARTLRSAQEQLALLDEKLGVGKGAVKERKRLKAIIEHEKLHEKARLEQEEKAEQPKKFKKGKRRDKKRRK